MKNQIVTDAIEPYGDFTTQAYIKDGIIKQEERFEDLYAKIRDISDLDFESMHFFTILGEGFLKMVDNKRADLYALDHALFIELFETEEVVIDFPEIMNQKVNIDLLLENSGDNRFTPGNESISKVNNLNVKVITDTIKITSKLIFQSKSTSIADIININNDRIKIFIHDKIISSFFDQFDINNIDYLNTQFLISAELKSEIIPLDFDSLDIWLEDQKLKLEIYFNNYFQDVFFSSDLNQIIEHEYLIVQSLANLLVFPLLIVLLIMFFLLNTAFKKIKQYNLKMITNLIDRGSTYAHIGNLFYTLLFKYAFAIITILYFFNFLMLLFYSLPVLLFFTNILLPYILLSSILYQKTKELVGEMKKPREEIPKLRNSYILLISFLVLFIVVKLLKSVLLDYILGFITITLFLSIAFHFIFTSKYSIKYNSRSKLEKVNYHKIISLFQKYSTTIIIILMIIPLLTLSLDVIAIVSVYPSLSVLSSQDPNIAIFGEIDSTNQNKIENPILLSISFLDQKYITNDTLENMNYYLVFMDINEYTKYYPQTFINNNDITNFDNGGAIVTQSIVIQNNDLINNANFKVETNQIEYQFPVSIIIDNLPGIDLLTLGSKFDKIEGNHGYIILSSDYYESKSNNALFGHINENDFDEMIDDFSNEAFILYYDKNYQDSVSVLETMKNLFNILSIFGYLLILFIFILFIKTISNYFAITSPPFTYRGMSKKSINKSQIKFQVMILLFVSLIILFQNISRNILIKTSNFEGNTVRIPNYVINPVYQMVMTVVVILWSVVFETKLEENRIV